MKTILKNLMLMVFAGVLFGASSYAYAQESVQPVKTVAPDPSNTLNTGKPIVDVNIFDVNSFKNIFSKKEKDSSLAYHGRLAYNTTNVINPTIVRYETTDRYSEEEEMRRERQRIAQARLIRGEDALASVGSAGVVLAQNGQVNYGVLILFILMLIVVIVLARLTIRKKHRIMNQTYYTDPVPPYQAPIQPGYQPYYHDSQYR